MKIEMRDPSTLIPYENNPKDHPPEQVASIARSITSFGFDQPVVITPEGVIIKGHGRTLAALQLKLPLIPVIISAEGDQHHRLNRVLDNKLQSRDYDQTALLEDLLVLKNADKLELALFTDSNLPLPPPDAQTAELQMFSLVTAHTCPKCSYRW